MCHWDRVSVRRAPLDGALPGPSRAKRRWGTIGSLSRQDFWERVPGVKRSQRCGLTHRVSAGR